MFRHVLLALLISVSGGAYAADGDACSVDSFYSQMDRSCVILSDGRVDTNLIDTSPKSLGQNYRTWVFSYGRCPANCEPGTADIYESNSSTIGAPNIGSRIGQLTGCGSAFVSSIDPRRPPLAFVWVDQVVAIADAQCTAPGVDIIATGIK